MINQKFRIAELLNGKSLTAPQIGAALGMSPSVAANHMLELFSEKKVKRKRVGNSFVYFEPSLSIRQLITEAVTKRSQFTTSNIAHDLGLTVNQVTSAMHDIEKRGVIERVSNQSVIIWRIAQPKNQEAEELKALLAQVKQYAHNCQREISDTPYSHLHQKQVFAKLAKILDMRGV